MSKPKKTDIYMRVTSGAFVTVSEKPNPQEGRLLVKVRTEAGTEDLFGFLFVDTQAVESCIKALERIHADMVKPEKIHPRMNHPPANGHKH